MQRNNIYLCSCQCHSGLFLFLVASCNNGYQSNSKLRYRFNKRIADQYNNCTNQCSLHIYCYSQWLQQFGSKHFGNHKSVTGVEQYRHSVSYMQRNNIYLCSCQCHFGLFFFLVASRNNGYQPNSKFRYRFNKRIADQYDNCTNQCSLHIYCYSQWLQQFGSKHFGNHKSVTGVEQYRHSVSYM